MDSNKEAGSLPEAPESTEDSVPGCHGVYYDSCLLPTWAGQGEAAVSALGACWEAATAFPLAPPQLEQADAPSE